MSHIKQLDGLRFIAIFLVIISHLEGPFIGGFAGVDIFFVLSGFLITSILMNEHAKTGSIALKNFYYRRFLRLTPALALLLLALGIMNALFTKPEFRTQNYWNILIAATYTTNWVRALSDHKMYLLGHTWSLAIEEQFYMFWPLILIFLSKGNVGKRTVVGAIVIIGVLSWLLSASISINGNLARIYNGVDTNAYLFMLGCGAAFCRHRLDMTKMPRFFLYLALAYIVAFTFIADQKVSSTYWIGIPLVGLASAYLILDIIQVPTSLFARFLSLDKIAWIGKISYGIYLWHYPVFQLMRARKMPMLTVGIVGTTVAIALAAASYYMVERQFMKLRIRRPPRATLVTA